jgi:predicted nucleotidyltransferase
MSASVLPACLTAAERAALHDFTQFVRKRFGARARDLRLFGSRARGEGHEDSDLDVLVTVDGLTPDERNEVWYETGHLMDRHSVSVGSLVVSSQHWDDLRDRERLIVAEVDRDGIAL